MKVSLLLASALCLSTLCVHAAPGKKRMGPSAVEAARLKNSPPPGYLSHYLPDDRYKIAGGVWKYVSTDLDTYYHLPQSANMMRQTPGSVLGFASAKDAEEAGYVADPTDGTSRAAAASMAPIPSASVGGQSAEDQRYVSQIKPILQEASQNNRSFAEKMQQAQNAGVGVTPAMQQAVANEIRMRRGLYARLTSIRPPTHLAKFHSLLTQSFLSGSNAITALGKMTTTGDLGQIERIQSQMMGAINLLRALMEEGKRQGIDPSLLR